MLLSEEACMSYLIHFNPNHDPKTGKFTFNKNNVTISRNGPTELTTYVSEKNVFKTKNKGSLMADGHNENIMQFYDKIGRNAARIYEEEKDVNKAINYIYNQIKDEPYRLVMQSTDVGGGQKWTSYQLDLIGDKYIYTTFGDSGVTYGKMFDTRDEYNKKFPDA